MQGSPSWADVTHARRAHPRWDGQVARRVVEGWGRGGACGSCLSGGPFRHGGAPEAEVVFREVPGAPQSSRCRGLPQRSSGGAPAGMVGFQFRGSFGLRE